MKKLVVLFIALWFTGSAQAQQMVYLQKNHDLPYRKLTPGDYLAVKTADEWIEGVLTDIAKDRLVINQIPVLYKEIEACRTWNNLLRTGGAGIMIAGLGYLGISAFNSLVNGESTILYPSEIVTGSSLAAGGWLMNRLSRKTYWYTDGWKLKVILPEQAPDELATPSN